MMASTEEARADVLQVAKQVGQELFRDAKAFLALGLGILRKEQDVHAGRIELQMARDRDRGDAGAATLLQRYGSLEAALKAGRFPAMAKTLSLYRSIATMDKKAPLPNLRSQNPSWDQAVALANEWELQQLARLLEELASG